jgi:hypothetical protein
LDEKHEIIFRDPCFFDKIEEYDKMKSIKYRKRKKRFTTRVNTIKMNYHSEARRNINLEYVFAREIVDVRVQEDVFIISRFKLFHSVLSKSMQQSKCYTAP